MSTRTQDELNAIWSAIIDGKYNSDPMVIAPRRISAEAGTDIMSIPNADGTDADAYERKDGGTWEEIPYLNQSWPVVLSALENPKFKWRTLEGIVKDTGLDVSTVTANISSNAQVIIKSSIPDPKGNDLFTTREHYREKSSIFERLQSAITNKVEK